MSEISLYEFIYRARLSEEALDRAGRISKASLSYDQEKLCDILGIDVLDDEHVARAEKMSFCLYYGSRF